jgi:hypothetical protein
LYGRYCHVCGQENIEPKETVWGLVSHFFYDITHFDGKFFSTSKYLITRPGFLPQEYLKGRRARYLHPIRMYVFSSALFFIFLFSMFNVEKIHWRRDKNEKKEAAVVEHTTATTGGKPYRYHGDSTKKLGTAGGGKHDSDINVNPGATPQPEMKKDAGRKDYTFPNTLIVIDPDPRYTSVEQYDSIQRTLPASQRSSWIERLGKHRDIELHNRYGDNKEAMIRDLIEHFMHTFPYLLFVSLPLYALYLRLLYRRHKQFYYVNHGIFLIYLYIFTFILLLVYFGLTKIQESLNWDWLGWVEALLLLSGVYYAYKAMRKFYGQRRGKTLLKFFILNTLAFFSVIFLFAVFFLFVAMRF